MARYKYIDTNPHFLSVDLARELLPGAFEHAVNHLLDHEVDLAHFDVRFRNDATGAPAYPPAMLRKVVLFAYSQGIVRSRAIERVCQHLRLGKSKARLATTRLVSLVDVFAVRSHRRARSRAPNVAA